MDAGWWLSEWTPLWLGALSVFLVAVYVYATWEFSTWRELGVPAPRPLPITGSLHKLWKKPVHEVDYEEHRTHGDIFGIYEGRRPAVQVADSELIKDVLQDKDFKPIPTILGGHRCPLMFARSSCEEELIATKHLTTVLQPQSIKKLTPWMEQSCKRLVEALHEDVVGKKISNIKVHMSQLVAEILVGSFLGIKAESGDGMELAKSMIRLALPKISMMTPVLAFFPEPLRSLLSPKPYPDDRIQELKETILKAVEKGVIHSEENILQMFLKEEQKMEQTDKEQEIIKDKQGLSKEATTQLILDMMLSAQEVTSNALTQIIYQLALNSDLQDQLAERLRKIEMNKWSEEAINQDTLIDAIISESLRIMPPVTRLQRKCCRKLEAKDISIPIGTPMIISVYTIHHNRDLYSEPDIFEVSRDFNHNHRNSIEFLPFGIGPHKCKGEHLAMKILKIATATILKQFHFETSILTQIPFEGALMQTLLTDRTGVWLKANIRV